jgi:hypothetical protein
LHAFSYKASLRKVSYKASLTSPLIDACMHTYATEIVGLSV